MKNSKRPDDQSTYSRRRDCAQLPISKPWGLPDSTAQQDLLPCLPPSKTKGTLATYHTEGRLVMHVPFLGPS